jgi:D-threo-aldose 1-dehydrogenase
MTMGERLEGLAALDPADTAPLGRRGPRVTRLGLGCAPLGNLFREVDDEVAHAVVERAYDAGIRLFDTAPLYGYGLSERRVGHVLRGKPRDSFVLATKVGRLLRADAAPDETQFFQGEPFYKGTPPVNPVFDFSYDGVMRSFEESLERLGLDRVDVLHIHDPYDHYDDALGGAYQALDHLRAQGVIRAVSAGMNQAEMEARFARDADFDCFMLAGRYTLLDQIGLRELLPLCEEKGIGIMAAGVYNSGILANPRPGAHYNYVPAPEDLVDKALRIKAACGRHGVPLKAAAAQFALGHPAVATVVIGCRSVEQLEDTLRQFGTPIPAALWEELKAEGLLGRDVPTP